MMPDSFTSQGGIARTAGREWLMQALRRTRARTHALFAAYRKGLAATQLAVPFSGEVNPPLWELGHIGWFQEWWIARNRDRRLGVQANPDCTRMLSRLAGADGLYDSGRVPHDSRWTLPFPDAAATHRYLQDVLDDTLALLGSSEEDDASLYFFRLALFHEDMHSEAAVYMAQSLGIALPAEIAFPRGISYVGVQRADANRLPGGKWELGAGANVSGFSFDNELGMHAETLAPFEIDAELVTWMRYLPFVEACGYDQKQWWTAEGWEWLQRVKLDAPRYLRMKDGHWQRQSFGIWQPLDLSATATHIGYHEAEAWCRWAGRRLPTETEWECAALTSPEFHWGKVWEWTASTFMPFPDFVAHPYRDYSAPWFGTRQVLRGACDATASQMIHPKYRNFFTADRNDIYAGFRTCAGD